MKKKDLIHMSHICSLISALLFIISIIISGSHIITTPIADMMLSWMCLITGWIGIGISYICKKMSEGK